MVTVVKSPVRKREREPIPEGIDGRIESILLVSGEHINLQGVVADTAKHDAQFPAMPIPKQSVVIRQKTSGAISIHVGADCPVTLVDAARAIRYEEQKRRGYFQVTQWKLLGCADVLPGVPEWELSKDGKRLITTRHPTRLPPTKIFELVFIALSDKKFSDGFAHECVRGICSSRGKEERCPWYSYGFRRCQDIRIQMARNAEK